MAKYLVVLIFILVGASAHAECSLNLSYGQGSVSNIPTEHIHDALTTEYTHVTTRVDGGSNVHEMGIECEIGRDYFIAVSHMDGLGASADHELYFNGYALGTVDVPGVDLSSYSFPGIQNSRVDIPPFTLPNIAPSQVDLSSVSVPGFKLLDIRERATASAWRVSLVKYFDMGKVDPYIRLGAEHARVIHGGLIPITDTISVRYRKPLDVTAPYAGVGVTYNRGRSVSFRAGAEFLSLSPHDIWTWSVGIDVPLRFHK
jgi:hypothetical protein